MSDSISETRLQEAAEGAYERFAEDFDEERGDEIITTAIVCYVYVPGEDDDAGSGTIFVWCSDERRFAQVGLLTTASDLTRGLFFDTGDESGEE